MQAMDIFIIKSTSSYLLHALIFFNRNGIDHQMAPIITPMLPEKKTKTYSRLHRQYRYQPFFLDSSYSLINSSATLFGTCL